MRKSNTVRNYEEFIEKYSQGVVHRFESSNLTNGVLTKMKPDALQALSKKLLRQTYKQNTMRQRSFLFRSELSSDIVSGISWLGSKTNKLHINHEHIVVFHESPSNINFTNDEGVKTVDPDNMSAVFTVTGPRTNSTVNNSRKSSMNSSTESHTSSDSAVASQLTQTVLVRLVVIVKTFIPNFMWETENPSPFVELYVSLVNAIEHNEVRNILDMAVWGCLTDSDGWCFCRAFRNDKGVIEINHSPKYEFIAGWCGVNKQLADSFVPTDDYAEVLNLLVSALYPDLTKPLSAKKLKRRMERLDEKWNAWDDNFGEVLEAQEKKRAKCESGNKKT